MPPPVKLMLSFEVLLPHYIKLSHSHSTLHCSFLAFICISKQPGTILYFLKPNSLIHLRLFSNEPRAISNQLPVRQGPIKTRQRLLCLQQCSGCDPSDGPQDRYAPPPPVPTKSWRVSGTPAQNPSFVSWGDKYRPIISSFKLWWKRWEVETEPSADTCDERTVKVIALTSRMVLSQQSQITQTDLLWPRVMAGGKEKEVKQL